MLQQQQIDYAGLVEKALLRVVHDVLGMVAEEGLPGRHHLYITFRTDHPGVVMDDSLHARYPNEMTIVLQHEFWGLAVSEKGFAVTLTFNNTPQRLEIPLDAVTVFADPSVEFGLQFTRGSALAAEPPPQELAGSSPPAAAPAPVAQLPAMTGKTQETRPVPVPIDEAAATPDEGAKQGEGADKVVTLDRFRKK